MIFLLITTFSPNKISHRSLFPAVFDLRRVIINDEHQFHCISQKSGKFVLNVGKSLYQDTVSLWLCFCKENQQNCLLQKTIILCSISEIHHTAHLLSAIIRIDKKMSQNIIIPFLCHNYIIEVHHGHDRLVAICQKCYSMSIRKCG